MLACETSLPCPPSMSLEEMSLIPLPRQVQSDTSSVFCTRGELDIITPIQSDVYVHLVQHLKEVLALKTDLKVEHLAKGKEVKSTASIELSINSSIQEGYALRIQEGKINIQECRNESVLFYLVDALC